MKRVLIIAHWYYPIFHGGVPRVAKFCKYLRDFGWEPTLIAPDWQYFGKWARNDLPDFCEVIRISDKACCCDSDLPTPLKMLMSPFRDYEDMPFRRLEKKMLSKARELCSERDFDVIFASSYPQYLHRVADKLHRETGLPWAADYRDLIDQDEFRAKGRLKGLKRAVRSFYNSRYIARDNRYVRSASVISTVSEGLAERLRARTGRGDIEVIMNGFDPEEYSHGDRTVKNGKMTVVYTGSLYGDRNIDVFCRGLALAGERCGGFLDNISLDFYGTCCRTVGAMLEKHPAALSVSQLHGNVTHERIVEIQCAADVLYLISHRAKGIATGKLFEYLAAGKQILSVPGDGDVTDRILSESGAGVVAGSPEAVADALLSFYDKWTADGRVPSVSDAEYVARFTRQAGAEKLAGLLERAAGDRR